MGSEQDRIFTKVGKRGVRCNRSCWDREVNFIRGFTNGRYVLDLSDTEVEEGGRKWVCDCLGAPDIFDNLVTVDSRIRDLRDCLMEEG